MPSIPWLEDVGWGDSLCQPLRLDKPSVEQLEWLQAYRIDQDKMINFSFCGSARMRGSGRSNIVSLWSQGSSLILSQCVTIIKHHPNRRLHNVEFVRSLHPRGAYHLQINY